MTYTNMLAEAIKADLRLEDLANTLNISMKEFQYKLDKDELTLNDAIILNKKISDSQLSLDYLFDCT